MASWKQYFEHGSAHADFCEANYAVSSFISEWWNTASSVLMALVGVIGFMLCVRHQLERRFKVMYLLLTLTGLGSTLFHATLSWAGQMSDEFPMILMSLGLLYTLITLNDSWIAKAPMLFAVLPYALVLYGAYATYITMAATDPVIFRFTFGGISVTCIAMEVKLYFDVADRKVRILFELGLGAFLLAFFVWIIDIELCPTISELPMNPQLHAWWHILGAMACHLVFVWLAYMRILEQGHAVTVDKHAGGLLPFARHSTKHN